MSTKEELKEFGEQHGLVAMLLQANIEASHNVTETLLENYRQEIKELKATIACIRDQVVYLASRPTIMNPREYTNACYPLAAQLTPYLEGELEV